MITVRTIFEHLPDLFRPSVTSLKAFEDDLLDMHSGGGFCGLFNLVAKRRKAPRQLLRV